jgi:2-dehydropantoate 2-reductase
VTPPILIWGAGAIGGSLGAAFVRSGHDVLFVDRDSEHVAAMNKEGLEITGPLAPGRVAARAVLPDDVDGLFDLVVLCVKAQDTEAAARALAPHLAPDGVVVSAQNGLNELTIAEAVGRQRTIGCFVNFGADYHGPGTVMYGGRGAVVVGELDGRRTPRLERLHALFQSFEPNAVLTSNIWGFLWSKLIYGALLFATALTDDSIADVLDDRDHRPALIELGREIARVAAAEGVRLEAFNGFDPAAFTSAGTAQALERSFADMVAFNRRSAKSHSGIWRDLAVRRRRTEIDAQIAIVLPIAARHGVPAPVNARLVELIHDLEAGRRERGTVLLDRLGEAMPTAGAGA